MITKAGHNEWLTVNHGDKFAVTFNQRASVFYQDFHQAADYTANLIYQKYNDKKIYVSLSGGLDSELVASVLLRNKIPFVPIILKIHDLNYLETWYAEYWCYQNNIVPVILEYNADEVVEAAIKNHKNVIKTNPTQIPNLIVLNYVEEQNGFLIYSTGDLNLELDKFYCERLDYLPDIIKTKNSTTAFFVYTPEIVLSYVNQFDTTANEQYNKLKFYKLAPRPKIDYLFSLKNLESYKKFVNLIGHAGLICNVVYKHYYGTKQEIINSLMPKGN